jgi:hypothetical protein
VAALDEADCRIVTRFRKNRPLNSAHAMPVEPATGVVSDRIGFLPGRQAKSRKKSSARRGARDRRDDGDGRNFAHLLQRPIRSPSR